MNACSILAKSQYRKRHDKVGSYVHWLLCKKYHLQCSDTWYTHKPQSVQEKDEYKILWDFNIQADKVIEHRRLDIVCINKQRRECQIIDFAIPGDQNIAIKEQEKIDKYQDLRIELQKVWNVKAVVTGSYRCSRNYVEENTSLYKTDWHPGRHNIHLKNSYPRNSLYPNKSDRHLRNSLTYPKGVKNNNNDNNNEQYHSENIVLHFEAFSYISLDSDGQNKY